MKAPHRTNSAPPSTGALRTRCTPRQHLGCLPGSAGFTLVEMLVTLVIVGLVSALLWQTLGQVAQIETRLADGNALVERDALRRAWVQQALAGIATDSASEPALPLRGDAQTLSLLTTMPPWPAAAGLERVTLRLRATEPGAARDAAHITLWAERGTDDNTLADRQSRTAPLALWSWTGRARFEYLGRDGRWLPQWPPPLTQPGEIPMRLPLAVRIVDEGASGAAAEGVRVWVPVVAVQNPMISRSAAFEEDRIPP